MLDHLKLWVADFERSRSFYEAALAPIGYGVLLEPAEGVVGLGNERPDLWLQQADDGHLPTNCHVAFRVGANELVDAFHGAALRAGGVDNGAPGERPEYHPGYYGAFVLDPDGNNVEAVCHTAPATDAPA